MTLLNRITEVSRVHCCNCVPTTYSQAGVLVAEAKCSIHGDLATGIEKEPYNNVVSVNLCLSVYLSIYLSKCIKKLPETASLI